MLGRTIIAWLLSSLSLAASAAMITVTGPGDAIANDGSCTLREAITAANTHAASGDCPAGDFGMDTIIFDIGGGGPQTINLLSNLPLVSEPVDIDASTQPGFNVAPLITINGGAGIDGLVLGRSTNGSIISSLAFSNCLTAITVHSASCVILGNYVGVNTAGTAATPNTTGIAINPQSSSSPAFNTIVGNVIGGNTAFGILIAGAPGFGGHADFNIVQGNTLGLNATRTAAIPNAIGIELQNVVSTQIHDNTIAGNSGPGLVLTNTSNTDIHDNVIGKPGLGNGAQGVLVNSGTGNAIYSNSMAGNGTLGIDLAPIGTTSNDACDLDTGANQLQNFPVLTSAVVFGGETIVKGSLNSVPSQSYTIEAFGNSAAPAQGETPLGFTGVATDGSCVGSFTASVAAVTPGQLVTATAKDGANNTSEMSAAVVAHAALPVTKNFAPSSIIRNTGTSTLTVSITNPNTSPETNLAFGDTLPPGIVIASTPAASSSCGGTVTATAGSGSVSLSGATLGAGATCSVSVNVTGGTAGSFVNTLPSAAVTSTESVNMTPATASLQVTNLPAPAVTKSFTPAGILPGGTTQLQITLTNSSTTAITGVQFTDQYPSGLVNTSAPGTTCGGSVTAPSGGSTLSLSGGTIPASGSCTVTVMVGAPNGGSFTNTLPAGSVTSANAAPSAGTASAALSVAASIPTTSEWGLLLILIALGAIAATRLRA